MSIILTLVLYLVVIGLLWYCTTLLPLPEPIPVIIRVLFILLAILVLLSAFGVLPGGHLPVVRL